MRILTITALCFTLNACMGTKPIANREIEVAKQRNILELGDNWNYLDVSKAKVIKRIKYRRADFFYDR